MTPRARDLPAHNLNPAAAPWARAIGGRLAAREDQGDRHEANIADLRKAQIVLQRVAADRRIHSDQGIFPNPLLGRVWALQVGSPSRSDVGDPPWVALGLAGNSVFAEVQGRGDDLGDTTTLYSSIISQPRNGWRLQMHRQTPQEFPGVSLSFIDAGWDADGTAYLNLLNPYDTLGNRIQRARVTVLGEPYNNSGSGGGGGGGGYTPPQAEYDFPTAVGQWTIPHTFGRIPAVTTYDDTGQLVLSEVYANASQVVVTWAQPTAGTAVLA